MLHVAPVAGGVTRLIESDSMKDGSSVSATDILLIDPVDSLRNRAHCLV